MIQKRIYITDKKDRPMTDFTSSLSRFAHSSRPQRSGLMRYLDLYRQRRALAALDADGLNDIGVSREAAQAEARRPIWDAPRHWS